MRSRLHKNGDDPDSINPDSSIDELGRALVLETWELRWADYGVSNVLEVIRIHLRHHELTPNGRAWLSALPLLEAVIASEIDHLQKLQARAQELSCHPALTGAPQGEAGLTPEAREFARRLAKALELYASSSTVGVSE
jgi:hypothetical protein